MNEDEIAERVAQAMPRYVEGSESSAHGVYWTIHDTANDDCWVASFQSRRERDERLRDLNARAAIAAHKAALAEAGFVIVRTHDWVPAEDNKLASTHLYYGPENPLGSVPQVKCARCGLYEGENGTQYPCRGDAPKAQ